MCPTVKFHRRAGNAFLRAFNGDYYIVKMVPKKLKEELCIIAKIAESARNRLPIAEERCPPPLSTLVFYTDAAGASFTICGGKKFFHNNSGKGVACIGGTALENIWGWSRLEWPDGLLTRQVDEKGRDFGSKSTTLEAVGMLLPFLVFSENIRGKNIVFRIDNIAVLYGWYSGYVRNDESATEVLKSVHYLSGLFGTTVHMEHVDRVSNEMALLADELSRKAFSDNKEMAIALRSAISGTVQGALIRWLEDPCGNNSLCRELLREQNSFIT